MVTIHKLLLQYKHEESRLYKVIARMAGTNAALRLKHLCSCSLDSFQGGTSECM